MRKGSEPDSGDRAVTAIGDGGRILVLAARTTALCESARRRHGLWPTAAAAVGRVLTAAGLLAVPLKAGGSLTVAVSGDGPLGGVVASAGPEGEVRGYALHPQVDLPPRPDGKLDVGGAVGRHGLVRVSKDLGLQRPYIGSSPLVSGEIGEDFTAYLLHSEQVPALVGLGVLVGRGGRVAAAGGLIVQLLPGAAAGAPDRVEANVADLGALSRAVEAGASPEELAAAALRGYAPRVIGETALRFRCHCSRARVRRLLAALPTEELRAMRTEDGQAEAGCRFCGRRYRFGPEELRALETRGAAPR